jgi:hypothetical protein
MIVQLDLPIAHDDPRIAELITILRDRGWITRRQIHELTGWSDRDVRAIAEAAFAASGRPKIVRGPLGFAVFDRATDDQIHHAADIAVSQGKKMIRYGLALRRALHSRIG